MGFSGNRPASEQGGQGFSDGPAHRNGRKGLLRREIHPGRKQWASTAPGFRSCGTRSWPPADDCRWPQNLDSRIKKEAMADVLGSVATPKASRLGPGRGGRSRLEDGGAGPFGSDGDLQAAVRGAIDSGAAADDQAVAGGAAGPQWLLRHHDTAG